MTRWAIAGLLVVACEALGWAQDSAYMVKDIRSRPGFETGLFGWDEVLELDGA